MVGSAARSRHPHFTWIVAGLKRTSNLCSASGRSGRSNCQTLKRCKPISLREKLPSPALRSRRETTGGPGAAGRTASMLRNIFAHAMRLGIIDNNPASGVRVIAGKRRERRLSTEEIKLLGRTMRQAEVDGEHAVALAVIRFLLLTGYRRSEAEGLELEWLHVPECYVKFPDTKTGGQIRPLGTVAGQLAESQPVQKHCPYVFPSNFENGHFTAVDACLARLCRKAGLENVTPHTLRHTFGSVAGDLGFSELTISALLGHAARSSTQGYVHLDDAIRLAVEKVSSEIARTA